MFVELIIAFSLIYIARSRALYTCSDILNRPTYKLDYCTFEKDGTVRCDILYKVQDHGYYIEHLFHFRVQLELKVIDPLNSTHACLGLASVLIDRVPVTHEKAWINATVSTLPDNLYTIFLRHVNYGFLKTCFNESYPIAVLEINNECQHAQSKDCSPIQHVNFLFEMKELDSDTSKFNSYWKRLKQWHHDMSGFNTELQLDFDVHFGEIKSLRLSHVFKNLSMMSLRLTGGNWGFLDNALLDDMKTLKILDLSNNEINSINNETFLETPELEVLILSDNMLKAIPVGIGNLKHLQKLDLSNNPIEASNGFSVIVSLSSLKQLNLAHIKLNDLDNLKPFLSTCTSELQLQILNLSDCNIQTLRNEDFCCQRELRVLDLSHNKLKEIPPEIVSTQKYLEALNISNNFLANSPQFILHDNVSNLDMSENTLYDVTNLIQSGKVKFLDLSGNDISFLSSKNMFSEHVQNLNLSHNKISIVLKTAIESLNTLDSVDLGANSYDCSDCSLPEFQNWLRARNTTKIYSLGSEEPLTCSVPLTDYERHIVDIDFDETLCLTNYPLFVGLPIFVILLVVFGSTGIFYFYRFEITYLLHLASIKKKSTKVCSYGGVYKYDAFVCYSGYDRSWVIGELMPTLESEPEKYRLCLHERDFPLGSFISQNIVSSLQTSRNTIVVLTNNFIKSDWCRWELELASHKLFEDRQEFLILIELEKIDRSLLHRHLKYLMDTRTYLEWPKSKENVNRAWRRLKEALGHSINQQQSERVIETQLS